MTTTELFEEITNALSLSPTAEYELKNILRGLDGETIEDDLED